MYEGIKDIYLLLEGGRLKEALTQLQALGTQAKLWNLQARIEENRVAYGYLLQYAEQGATDPARAEFYRKTLRNAYELTDLLDIALTSQKTSGTYYDRIRTFGLHAAKTYAQLQTLLETFTEDIGTINLIHNESKRLQAETERIHHAHEEAVQEMFDKTWATPQWSDVEAIEATALLDSLLIAPNDLAVMVSAVTLALVRMLDVRKMNFLFNAYRHTDPQVSQRAIVGIAITLYKHAARIALYPEIRSRLSLLSEEEGFRQNLHIVQMQLLITRETEKIDKKMREEIIPEMLKNTKLKHSKFRFDETEDTEDRNPDWEEWIDKSGISEKIKQMSEWHMAGADVYMSSFAQLKQYPFFQKMPHWFYTFDINQPILAAIRQQFNTPGINPLKLIAYSIYFCNSDKYSFSLAMTTMPERMRTMTIQQIEEQNQADPEAMDKMNALMQHTPEAKDVSRQYIQDLYRFCKLWRNRHEEEDFFRWKFDLWNTPMLKEALSDMQILKNIADYLLQNDYLEEAYNLYDRIIRITPASAEIQQKAGYIQQKRKQYTEAIAHYQHADLLQPDNVWTNKHLAQCYKLTGNIETALEYYRKVEAAEPDNLHIALQIGQCLARLEQYADALAYFYKVEYLEKNPDNARRAIAWCNFVSGKREEALKHYALLLEAPNPKAQDQMNAAHVYLASGQMQEALTYYRLAQSTEKSHATFIEKFNKDRESLKSQGLTDEDLNIVLDLLA